MARRGCEGLAELTKEHVALLTDDDGRRYYKKVLGEESKNHKTDSENMENGGTIPYEINDFGFNPRRFFHLWMTKQSPTATSLFNHIKRPSRKFKLKFNPQVWFSDSKMGKNEIPKAVPELCRAVGVPRCTNQQLRPTSVQSMKRGGAEDREIVKVTGQHVETLKHYDSTLLRERQHELALSISNMGRKRKATASISEATNSKTPALSNKMEAQQSSTDAMNCKPSTSRSSVMDAKSSSPPTFEDPIAPTEVQESQQYDTDDSCDEVFTQEFTTEDTAKFLKKEQEIMEQQMELFKFQQKFMSDSLKMRHEIASKKLKKKQKKK